MGDYEDGPGFEVSWLGWRYVIAFLALPAAYLILFEWLASATPGKLVVGISVRTEQQGGRISLAQSVVRNLARAVDAIPYVIPYLVGAVVISGSPSRQRLGDRWAKTVVIAWGSERLIAPMPPPPDVPPRSLSAGPLPQGEVTLPPPPEPPSL